MTDLTVERDRSNQRITFASEIATIGVAALLLLTAALPSTADAQRVGLVWTAVALGIFTVAWFHIVPQRVFGRYRFAIGAAATQVIAALLLHFTGGLRSEYFPYFLLPILSSCFALRMNVTARVSIVAILSFLTVGAADPTLGLQQTREAGAIRLFALVSFTFIAVLLAQTVERTRQSLSKRTIELADQNLELDTARSIALRLSRLRERDEILRAIHDTARRVLQANRVWVFFKASNDYRDGYTVGIDGEIESFVADTGLRDPARLRPIREMRTVVVQDADRDAGFSESARKLGLHSAILVPLVQRGRAIGVEVFSCAVPRDWSAREIRLAETIAEGSAAAVATLLALDELRDERRQIAERARMYEALANLSEALAIATDEVAVGKSAARVLQHTFDLRGATVLFSDPSLALLEPRASVGDPTAHPVVTGPENCPAIRSSRTFKVESADSPVVCPHVPFPEGTRGFVCTPLAAAGQTVGVAFLEPGATTKLDETVLLGATDRIALTIANMRILESAQRQAVTDGLTGLYNRHFMDEQLRLLHSLASRHARVFSIIAVDLDQLKRVNDTLGHEAGDLVIRGFANALRRSLRGSDVPVRTGGDEFVALLPDTGLAEATMVAERVRQAVDEQGRAEPNTAISTSIGVAAWVAGRSGQDVIEAADAMLYQAKRAGRDRVVAERETTPVL